MYMSDSKWFGFYPVMVLHTYKPHLKVLVILPQFPQEIPMAGLLCTSITYICVFNLNTCINVYTCFFLHFSGGTYIALFVVILIDFVGPEKLSSGSGLAIMCLGLFNIPIPSIYGRMFIMFSFIFDPSQGLYYDSEESVSKFFVHHTITIVSVAN